MRPASFQTSEWRHGWRLPLCGMPLCSLATFFPTATCRHATYRYAPPASTRRPAFVCSCDENDASVFSFLHPLGSFLNLVIAVTVGGAALVAYGPRTAATTAWQHAWPVPMRCLPRGVQRRAPPCCLPGLPCRRPSTLSSMPAAPSISLPNLGLCPTASPTARHQPAAAASLPWRARACGGLSCQGLITNVVSSIALVSLGGGRGGGRQTRRPAGSQAAGAVCTSPVYVGGGKHSHLLGCHSAGSSERFDTSSRRSCSCSACVPLAIHSAALQLRGRGAPLF